jgi:hypothetical protein
MELGMPKALKLDDPDVTLRRDVRESFVGSIEPVGMNNTADCPRRIDSFASTAGGGRSQCFPRDRTLEMRETPEFLKIAQRVRVGLRAGHSYDE